MGTRATIQVEGCTTAKLYKHWDGNPKATLPWLERFNKTFTEKRGVDNDYKLAQLIRSSIFDAEEFGLDQSKETGWGIVAIAADCGADYSYRLMKDGTVTVKEL